jgi:HipA-like C-terminal domain
MVRFWTPPAQGAYLSQPALPFVRPVVRIDGWTPLGFEQVGTKPKQWFAGPDGHRWLFKKVVMNPAKGGGRYLRGDDWAEVVSSDIGRSLGIPTATVELAQQSNWSGVISRNVAGEAALVLGNEFLAGRDSTYTSISARINPLYTVHRVMAKLSNVEGPPDSDLTAQMAFAGYLTLDALIGNTDRHHQNWALLQYPGTSTSTLYLSPTFDHASSLGFLLNDTERLERLAGRIRDRTVQTYATNARTPFATAASPMEAAMQALSLLNTRDRHEWINRTEDLGDDFEVVMGRVPQARMSIASHDFALALVRYNLDVLLREARRLR